MSRFGVHSVEDPVGLRQTYPLADVIRAFKNGVIPPQNLIPAFEHIARPALNEGMSVVVSFKPSPTHVANGEWRIYIEQLGRHLQANDVMDRVVIVLWHEPEDDARDSYPNGTPKMMSFKDGAEFVTYFNTLHDWLKSVDPRIQTSHAALGYAYRPTVGGKHDKSAYVTDPTTWVTRADIHSIDLYSGRSFPVTDTLAVSPAFKRWLTSRPDNAEWGVAERGWPTLDLTGRAAAITEEMTWLKALPAAARPVFYIVWATKGTENDPKLLLDATAIAAVNEGFTALDIPDAPPVVVPDTPAPATMTCPLCHGSGVVPEGAYTVTHNVTATHA